MFSILKSFLLTVIFTIISIDATCPKVTVKTADNTNSAPTLPAATTASTANINLQIAKYHICPRTMNNWLLQTYNISLRCAKGYSGSLCRKNLDCLSSASTCCQQEDGCNKCVG